MHIPDGYLSPSTCAVAYAAAVPIWYVALGKVKRMLHTRMVPLLALFSAFSFVIMMFNLPLPGGTTGHAVGMAVAAIVLGPWGALVAISIALLIQAVFFGDGGITSYAANCFNMAISGSFVAWWAYSMIAGQAALDSPRRAAAAAIAGYLSINVAALFAAFEFGIQPMLFQDAGGAPLYAPYPLPIAVPAMMVGHLSFAGIAELVISGGLVAYLQRAHPELLGFAARIGQSGQKLETVSVWRTTRALWYALAVLMIVTPLGLLAAGTAWGEWGTDDFANAGVRQEIQLASGNAAPPEAAPEGMARLAGLWTAPIPDYAPGFMRSEGFGYILSALFGSGLILLAFLTLSRFFTRRESAGA